MHVIWHDYVRAEIRAVIFSALSESQQSLINLGGCENRTSIVGTRGDKINRRRIKNSFETPESFFARFAFWLLFGGHRPPLHREAPQPRQQLLMDPVESAIAEDGHDVRRLEERHQLLDDVSGIRFVKGRPARSGD